MSTQFFSYLMPMKLAVELTRQRLVVWGHIPNSLWAHNPNQNKCCPRIKFRIIKEQFEKVENMLNDTF